MEKLPRYVEYVRVSTMGQARRGTPESQVVALTALRASRPGVAILGEPVVEAGVSAMEVPLSQRKKWLRCIEPLIHAAKLDEIRVAEFSLNLTFKSRIRGGSCGHAERVLGRNRGRHGGHPAQPPRSPKTRRKAGREGVPPPGGAGSASAETGAGGGRAAGSERLTGPIAARTCTSRSRRTPTTVPGG